MNKSNSNRQTGKTLAAAATAAWIARSPASMNPLVPHRALFERKAASYQARWPWLKIEPTAAFRALPAQAQADRPLDR